MNTTGKATWAIVAFHFPDGTSYNPDRIMLQPHQAAAIDIQALRASKQTDVLGNPFVATEDHGQLTWLAGAVHAIIGRAEQVNAGAGFAKSFSCGECACPYNVRYNYMSPASGTFASGYANYSNYSDFYPYAYMTDCNNNQYGPYNESNAWSTDNPNIATTTSADLGGDIQAIEANSTVAVNDWVSESYYDDGMGDCYDDGPVDYEEVAQVVVQGGPQIMLGGCNGANINGQTTTVVIGQQIALCATGNYAGGVDVTGYSWSIPGVIVAGYAPSSASASVNTNVVTNQQSTTFYWPFPATSTQTVTLTVYLSNGASPSVTAMFNIGGPSPETPTVDLQTDGLLTIIQLTDCLNNPYSLWLDFGYVTGPDPGLNCVNPQYVGYAGIKITPPSPPPTPQGHFFFVQLIEGDYVNYTHPDNSVLYCTGGPGLDSEYPYEAELGFNQAVTDAPFSPLPPTYIAASRSFSATMYLMWQSTDSNIAPTSIPVPMGYVPWSFSGSTAQTNGNWSTPSGDGSAQNFTAASTTTDFPTWSGKATNASNSCN